MCVYKHAPNNHELMNLCVFRLWSPVGEETHKNNAGHGRRRKFCLGQNSAEQIQMESSESTFTPINQPLTPVYSPDEQTI